MDCEYCTLSCDEAAGSKISPTPRPQCHTIDVLTHTVYCRVLPSLGYCLSFVCGLPRTVSTELAVCYQFRGFHSGVSQVRRSRRSERTLNFGRCRRILSKCLKPHRGPESCFWIISALCDRPSTQVVEGMILRLGTDPLGPNPYLFTIHCHQLSN